MSTDPPAPGSHDAQRGAASRPDAPASARAPVIIDGSRGEGGGQILRTSLALAMITGRPLQMFHIRARRAKPGLRRQHLACVEAAARLCRAEVHGARVGSQDLVFVPGTITGGELAIDIGTAGSTTLVVQTIAVPAIAAGVALRAVIRGGTHNPLAPPFEFLDRVWLPHLRAMGAELRLTLDRHGFASGGRAQAGRGRRDERTDRQDGRDRHDRDDRQGREEPEDGEHRQGRAERARQHRAPGGARSAPGHDPTGEAPTGEDRGLGQLTLEIAAGSALRPIELVEAGPIVARRATAILSRLPSHVAARELAIVQARLGFAPGDCEVREVVGAGIGNVLQLEVERAEGRELVSSFGAPGLRAERVAERACDDLAGFVAAGVPVGEHLADQLLLPLAVAGGGRFRSQPLSQHATTNIATIQAFLDVAIDVEPIAQSTPVAPAADRAGPGPAGRAEPGPAERTAIAPSGGSVLVTIARRRPADHL